MSALRALKMAIDPESDWREATLTLALSDGASRTARRLTKRRGEMKRSKRKPNRERRR